MADDAESWNSPKKAGGSTTSSGTSSPAPSAPEATLSTAPSVAEATLSPEPPASGARFSPPPPSPSQLSCAACKHMRRRCRNGCPFASHFPGDRPEAFEKVQRIFAVSNVQNLMERAGPSQRELFLRTIKFEANAWAENPVHGAIGIIQDLVVQLRNVFIELVFLHLKVQECVARVGQQMGEARQQPAAQGPSMVVSHAAAATQHYDNRSTAQQHSGTARGVTQGHGRPSQHQTTGARQAPAGSRAAREQNMAMSNAAAATQNDYNRNRPAAQYNGTALDVTHGHGRLSQHQTMVQQMSVGYQAAAAVEGARQQNFQATPRSSSSVGMAAAPLGSAEAGAFFFQQQHPPPPPLQPGTPPRYPQEQPSRPPP